MPPDYGPGNPLSTGPFPPGPGLHGAMPPADDGWGKVGVLMVVLALAFAGGVAYFIATSESSEAETAAAAEVETLAEGTEVEGSSGTDSELATQVAQVIPDGGVAAALIATAKAQDGGAVEIVADNFDAGSDPLRANGEVDRPTGLISMSIESEPAGAQVIRKSDGVRLGVTPYRYEVESASGKVIFILNLEGYRSMILPMPADRDSERQVMLFPGKGGAPVPVAPAQTAMATPELEETPKDEKPETSEKGPTPKKIAKPARVKKQQTRPKRPKKVPQPKQPHGTVDIGSEPIPLD